MRFLCDTIRQRRKANAPFAASNDDSAVALSRVGSLGVLLGIGHRRAGRRRLAPNQAGRGAGTAIALLRIKMPSHRAIGVGLGLLVMVASVQAFAGDPPAGQGGASSKAESDPVKGLEPGDAPPPYDARQGENSPGPSQPPQDGSRFESRPPVPQRFDEPFAEPNLGHPMLTAPVVPGAGDGTLYYGAQIVLADLVGVVGAVVVGARFQSVTAALGTYLLAAPLVHVLHGQPGTAFGSLLLHVAAPGLGILVSVAMIEGGCGGGDIGCAFMGLLLGGVGGLVAATAIDAGFLAKKTPERPLVSLVPTIQVAGSGTTTLGLAGRF